MSTSSSSSSLTRLDRLVCAAQTSAPASSPGQRDCGDGRRQDKPAGQLDQHAPVNVCAKVDRISITLSRSSLGELGEEDDYCDNNNSERGRRRDTRARAAKSSSTTITTEEPSSEKITRVSRPRTTKLNRFFSLCARDPTINPFRLKKKPSKLLANPTALVLPSKRGVSVKQKCTQRSNQNNLPLLAPSLLKTPSLTPSITHNKPEDTMMVSSPEDDESDDESTNPHTTITATTAASSRSPTLRAVKRAAVGPFKRPHKHLLLQRCHSAPTARSFGLYPFTAAPAPPHTASVALDLAVGAGVMTPQRVAVARVVDAYHLDGASLPSRVYTSMDVHAATPHTRKILEEYGAAGCAWGWDGGFGFGGRRRMIDGKTGLLAEPDINPFL